MKRIVPIYPWPMHPKVAEAFDAIEDINPVEAVPGGPGPIVAIKKLPPFVCDALLVSDPSRVADAVNVVTSNGIEMVSMRQVLEATLSPNGVPMVEYLSEKISKVRFV
jgi:hypothetical protein